MTRLLSLAAALAIGLAIWAVILFIGALVLRDLVAL